MYCFGVVAGITEDGKFVPTVDSFDECGLLEDDKRPVDTKRLITFSDLAGHKKYLKITGR